MVTQKMHIAGKKAWRTRKIGGIVHIPFRGIDKEEKYAIVVEKHGKITGISHGDNHTYHTSDDKAFLEHQAKQMNEMFAYERKVEGYKYKVVLTPRDKKFYKDLR